MGKNVEAGFINASCLNQELSREIQYDPAELKDSILRNALN